jgi:hypothetical protein
MTKGDSTGAQEHPDVRQGPETVTSSPSLPSESSPPEQVKDASPEWHEGFDPSNPNIFRDPRNPQPHTLFADPDYSPMVAKCWDNSFQQAHALYLKEDFEGALASAEKDLLDPQMPRSTMIQLLLIAAQCSTDREQRYRRVSLVTASGCQMTCPLC